ncbi:MAG: GNAT family N-acetyltransferase [Deltaproteobacteria bacterium]|nr:GNAT family N-acetyltransferase [Deltaproteobacteria bacterium]
MTDQFVIEPLSSRHGRAAFSCGVEPLDRYLQTQANQDIRRHISNCFVAVPEGVNGVAGYYTMAASSIPVGEIPPELSRKLPRYPVLPAVLIGRFAVDRRFTGQSLGSALLYDVIARTLRADPAVFALIVDAKDEIAGNYYMRFGFRPFASRPLSFFLPMGTAAKLIEK